MLFLIILLIIVAIAALCVGVVFSELYLTRSKNVYMSLIPPAAVALASYITLIVMLAVKAKASTTFVTFYLLQIPVIAGVLALAGMRLKKRRRIIEEHRKQMKKQNAMRMETERRNKMEMLVKGFRCAESSMKVEGQHEIAKLCLDGRSPEEIAGICEISVEEADKIATSFKKYCNRVDSDDRSTADRILTPEQEESIVNFVVNSTPAENNLSATTLWNRTTVRLLASNLIGSNLSSRMITAYLSHWGLTVPESQTIKARSTETDVRLWLGGEYEKIRRSAELKGGEIIWIYTVYPEAIKDVSSSVPMSPVMLCAVTMEGAIAFRVYDSEQGDCFNDFIAGLTSIPQNKLYAVVNEKYDEYMNELGKDRRRALSSRIEFFKGIND